MLCFVCTRSLEFKFQAGQTAKLHTALQTARNRFKMYANIGVAMPLSHGDGHRKLITRIGVLQRV